MGREWYWGGRSSKRGSGEKENPSGCISAVLQFFDLHHPQFAFRPQQQHSFNPTTSFLSEELPTILKGVEAPRNSLESEGASSLSSMTKEEENLNIPMGIQIKTSGDTRSKVGAPCDLSSEISSSPGTKTPNLVARLMGLDLLPDSYSPSSSSTPSLQGKPRLQHFRLRQAPLGRASSHRNCMDSDMTGTRSMPETPRISSARRSDVDHRLSLQINKENIEELEFSRYSCSRRNGYGLKHEDDNRSPNHYARQIVKQIKESVSRRVGLDITNTVGNREQRRDELVGQLKFRKLSKPLLKVVDETSADKHSTLSCSPRLRFLDSKNKPSTALCAKDHTSQPPKPPPLSSLSSSLADNHSQPIKVQVKPKSQPLQEHPQQQQKAQQKCKKVGGERFGPRLKKPPQTSDIIRNKQEKPFVRPSTAARANIPDKKCKKTPLSSELLNITVPTLLPVKKDHSPPATKIPQKQVFDAQTSEGSSQLFSCLSQRYKQEATQKHAARDSEHDKSNDATTNGGGEEFQYVSRILRCSSIDKDTPVSFTRWFSPSHPLDPSIFHHLENSHRTITTIIATNESSSSQLNLQCNRRLIFHLVDEILIEILKPYFNMKPWVMLSSIRQNFGHMQGSELIDALCAKIKSFPLCDCRVLEDIDTLIDKDLPKFQFQTAAMAFKEEGEGIVSEIEMDVLDTLIHETATMLFFGVAV